MTRDFGSRTMLLCIAMAVTAVCAWGQEVSQASPIESGWKLQFSDDFERDALGSNWSAGLARIEDGALAIGRESDMGNNVVTCQKAFPGAQRLEYDATTAAAEPCDLSAVLGGDGSGYSRGYFFGFGSQMNTCGRLIVKNQLIEEYHATITPGKWHHVICQREGHRFTHVIDGEVVLDYTHQEPLPSPVHQKVGFYVWHVGRIDNVEVYTKAETVRIAQASDLPSGVGDNGPGEKLVLEARTYPDPGKILVSVEVPRLEAAAEAAHVVLRAHLRRAGSSEALRELLRATAPEMREELVFDAAELPAGDYAGMVELQSLAGERIGEKASVEVRWPGRSEAFEGIKVINNFVWELLDINATGGAEIQGPHEFRVPYDRWLFVRSQAEPGREGRILLMLDSERAEDAVSIHGSGKRAALEAMRFVSAGEHVIHVVAEGAARLQHLQVRAVPEIQHSRYPTTIYHVKNGGDYDWEFLSRYILPNVNTIIGSSVADSIVPHVREWKSQGGKWILYTSRPGLSGHRETEETPERCLEHFSNVPGFTHPLMNGVLVDEFYTRDDPAYDVYTEMVKRINAAPEFSGKAFNPYAAGNFGKDEGSIRFAQACIEGGGYVCWEAYQAEWATKKEALNHMRRYPHSHIIPFEESLPGVTRNIIWVFGAFSFPWPYADGFASVNYNAYLDMQFQFIATHPALFGLGGVHIWRSGYCDEERVRWFGRFFRHYCIEGNTGRVTGDPYLLTHIANPDFTDGTEGWTLNPASEGSIAARERDQFGKLLGRHYRGPDTFLWTKRDAARPNTFSQRISGLSPGRLYSVKMFSGDYGAFAEGRSEEQVHPVSLDITGCDLLEGSEYQYQVPFPTRARMGEFTRQHPFWLNYHWHVFRAAAPTAMLAISDWKAAEEPGGPAGQELLYTYIEVKPYLEK